MNTPNTRRDIDRLYWRWKFGRIGLDALLAYYRNVLDRLSMRKRQADEELIDWPADSAPIRLGIELDKWIMNGIEALGFQNAKRTRWAIHTAYDCANRIAEITRVREELRAVEGKLSNASLNIAFTRLLLESANMRLLREGNATKATYLMNLGGSLATVEPTTFTCAKADPPILIPDPSSLNQRLRVDLDWLSSWLSQYRTSANP